MNKQTLTTRKDILLGILSAVLLSIFAVNSTTSAVAFDPGRIMDDAVMSNNQSMSAEQIQAFLNSKVPICDTNGSRGTTPTSRKEYFSANGWPLPIVCLKDYNENDKTSAQIIYDAAQEYKINPQVLIVLLQKEQGLITDDWPSPTQYRSATGYGCPDTAVCESKYYGFTNQVRNAANMFRKILDASPAWYTPYAVGNSNVSYNPNSNCGSTVINIQNRATQALYNYTPYQPNQAALNAGYGLGDGCSAYGNRNFYLYFSDWFGSTYGIIAELEARYNEISSHIGTPSDMGYCSPDKAICWQQFKKGFIVYSPTTGAWESKGAIRDQWAKIGFQSGAAGLPTGPEVYDSATDTWSQSYQNGVIVGKGRTGFWLVLKVINEYWVSIGGKTGKLGLPVSGMGKSGDVSWQQFQNGFIVYSPTTGAWESKGAIRDQWAKIGFQSGAAGLPTGPEVYDSATDTWSQSYQNGVIYYSSANGAWIIQKEPI